MSGPVARGIVAALFACACAAPARAQSPWLDRDRGNVLQVETVAPDPVPRRTFPTWAWFVDGRTRVAGPGWFVADAAFAHVHLVADRTFGFFGSPTGQSVLGDPYLGLEVAPRTNGPRFGAGVRPWISAPDQDSALLTGRAADLAREEAFLDATTVYRVALGWHRATPARGGIGFDAEVAPALWTASRLTQPRTHADLLAYGATMRYAHRATTFGAGLSGRRRIDGGGFAFAAASQHQLDLALDVLHGRLRPGVELLVPLDHARRLVAGNTWGLSLAITPR